MRRKQNLASALGITKRKLRVTMHFLEISKLQIGKERHTLLCILKLFTNIVDYLFSKNAWLPPIFFLISITLVKICFSRMFSKPRKNTFELVVTGLKRTKMIVLHAVLNISLPQSQGLKLRLTGRQCDQKLSAGD